MFRKRKQEWSGVDKRGGGKEHRKQGWREGRKGREEKWYKRRVKEKAPGIVPIHDVNAESVLKNGENNGATPPGSDSPFPRRFERRAFLHLHAIS